MIGLPFEFIFQQFAYRDITKGDDRPFMNATDNEREDRQLDLQGGTIGAGENGFDAMQFFAISNGLFKIMSINHAGIGIDTVVLVKQGIRMEADQEIIIAVTENLTSRRIQERNQAFAIHAINAVAH